MIHYIFNTIILVEHISHTPTNHRRSGSFECKYVLNAKKMQPLGQIWFTLVASLGPSTAVLFLFRFVQNVIQHLISKR